MKMIDVLNKQCNGEIRKGTKLIVDFSYEQDSPEQIDKLVKQEKGDLNMELIIFTINGYTYEFNDVKNLTSTTNGITFEYFSVATDAWQTATFDYRGISGYAIENAKEF